MDGRLDVGCWLGICDCGELEYQAGISVLRSWSHRQRTDTAKRYAKHHLRNIDKNERQHRPRWLELQVQRSRGCEVLIPVQSAQGLRPRSVPGPFVPATRSWLRCAWWIESYNQCSRVNLWPGANRRFCSRFAQNPPPSG